MVLGPSWVISWCRYPSVALKRSFGWARSDARPARRSSRLERGISATAGAAATLPRAVLLLTSMGKGLSTTRSVQPSMRLSVPTSRSATTSCIRGTFSMRFSVWLNPPPDVPEPMTSRFAAKARGLGGLVTS